MKTRIGCQWWMVLALVLLVACAPSAFARGKAGGGFVLSGGGPMSNQNLDYNPGGYFGVGGQGVSYAGLFLRTGLELNALMSQTGASVAGGLFGDFVFGHIANADIFAGLGLGYGGGPTFFNAGSIYLRPEFGIQWNLGRAAIDAKLFSMIALPAGLEYYSVSYGGISVGLLFGQFPINNAGRGPAPAPRRTPPPPRVHRRRLPPPPRAY